MVSHGSRCDESKLPRSEVTMEQHGLRRCVQRQLFQKLRTKLDNARIERWSMPCHPLADESGPLSGDIGKSLEGAVGGQVRRPQTAQHGCRHQ